MMRICFSASLCLLLVASALDTPSIYAKSPGVKEKVHKQDRNNARKTKQFHQMAYEREEPAEEPELQPLQNPQQPQPIAAGFFQVAAIVAAEMGMRWVFAPISRPLTYY